MKRLALIFSLFFTTPAFAGEITSKITDSIQLSVQGAAVQSKESVPHMQFQAQTLM